MNSSMQHSIILILILCVHTVFATENTEPIWVFTAAAFKTADVPDVYASYANAVPEMLNFFCKHPINRLVSGEEKKARMMVSYSEKKLSLVKDRAALIKQRDMLYLAVFSEKKKLKQMASFNKKIQAKEKEIADLEKRITVLTNSTDLSDEIQAVKLWKEGTDVFKQPEYTNLVYALKNEKINAAITGSIQDLAGYMYITATLTSGLAGMKEYTFSEAGSYQSVQAVTKSLAFKIMEAIRNIQPSKVRVTVEPVNAEIYIDNEQYNTATKVLYLFEGEHTISVQAKNYETAHKIITAKKNTNYDLKIMLHKEKQITVSFPFSHPKADIFMHTKYFGNSPLRMQLAAKKSSIVTFWCNDIKTYVLVDPYQFAEKNTQSYSLQTQLNKIKTEKTINRRRKILYWSLGALYVSLPIFMILQGLTLDMASSIRTRKSLLYTEKTKAQYDALWYSTVVMNGITIALGINYAVQLGFYLHAADKSLPREAAVKK